jgi:hypothetical protein
MRIPRIGVSFLSTAAVGLVALLASAASPATAERSGDLDQLIAWMTGTFSSAAQAADSEDHFTISLHMTPVWSDRTDAHWVYVEQAVAEYSELPYRQRIYRIAEVTAGLFEIRIFILPDPLSVVGAWRTPTMLDSIGPEDLTERAGCSMLLRRRGDTFEGSTLATLCGSTLRGASYASSQVVITANGMVSWDRGFAEDGSQVWGAVTGGYVFDRIIEDPVGAEAVDGDDGGLEQAPTAEDGVGTKEASTPG